MLCYQTDPLCIAIKHSSTLHESGRGRALLAQWQSERLLTVRS
jgi:hypothetical protein